MTTAERLGHVAETDSSFRRVGPNWVGKCLICNGPLAFDIQSGEGATLEHIRARSRGGNGDLENLGIVHGRCNWEKGVRWDSRKRRSELSMKRSSRGSLLAASNVGGSTSLLRRSRENGEMAVWVMSNLGMLVRIKLDCEMKLLFPSRSRESETKGR